MRRIYPGIVIVLLCLHFTVVAQERPRPDVRREPGKALPGKRSDKWERRDKEADDKRRESSTAKTVEKRQRWKGDFKSAVDGRVTERRRDDNTTRNPGNPRRVEKADRWERKDWIKKDFNDAANPKNPPGGKGNGGNSAPPSAPPAPRPRP